MTAVLRPSVLVLAFILSIRAWWGALIQNQVSVMTALVWFLVAVPIAALVLAGFRTLSANYQRTARRPDRDR